MKPARLGYIPEAMRRELKESRLKRGWSQLDLGRHTGLPQVHISKIETGKIVPRFDTLLDLVRVLGYDLLMVPRPMVPVVQALVQDSRREASGSNEEEDEIPLYAIDDEAGEGDEDGRLYET